MKLGLPCSFEAVFPCLFPLCRVVVMKMPLGLFPFDLDGESKLSLRSEVLVGLLPCICSHGCFSGCCGKVPLLYLVFSGLSFVGLVVDCQGRLVTGCGVGGSSEVRTAPSHCEEVLFGMLEDRDRDHRSFSGYP